MTDADNKWSGPDGWARTAAGLALGAAAQVLHVPWRDRLILCAVFAVASMAGGLTWFLFHPQHHDGVDR